MTGTRRIVFLLFAGSLLLQLAWIVTLPPFRGIDEFDHAYRAAAVAHGQWMADNRTPVPNGRGDLVVVPRSLVEAARPECYTYTYTQYSNCNPASKVGDGFVTVASGAANYNPVFYWIVGTPAKFFVGATSLQVMRLVSALLCSALIAGVGWVLTRWATTAWPLVGLLVGLTPTVMYTSILPAPNGVEMLGGLGLWAALLGLTRVGADAARERTLVHAAAAMAVPLVFVRSLGPLWLAMIVLTMVAYVGWRRICAMIGRNPRAWATSSGVVILATLLGFAWTVASGTNSTAVKDAGHFEHPLLPSTTQVILWPFQSFAAFPTRDELAPMFVYMLGFLVLLVVLAVTMRLADRRTHLLLWLVMFLSLAIPWLITLKTYGELGEVWQGRYTLPYALGLPLIAAISLDATRSPLRFVRPCLLLGFLAYLTAHVTGTLHVLLHERHASPLAGTQEWWIPPIWLVVALISAGMVAWCAACVGRAPDVPADADSPIGEVQPSRTPVRVRD